MKRSSYLKYDEYIQLGRRPLYVWGYGKTGKFVCRLEINAAGIAVYAGTKGGRRLADAGWETLVKRLTRQ
jgi:hypothetical protein